MQSFGLCCNAPLSALLIYSAADSRDRLVAEGKQGKLSAAVVFLPEYTPHYGQHGSDRCYCKVSEENPQSMHTD